MGSLAGLVPSQLYAAVCPLTEPNSMGPYYRKNALFTSRLAAVDEPGEKLIVTGQVFSQDGCTPLKNTIIDAWQANANGEYYDVDGNSGNTPAEYRLRGRVRTDQSGTYTFETIMPGQYYTRPKHIHFIAYHPKAKPLVTQMYFSGDPLLASDALARQSLIVTANNGLASFDIVLAPQ